MGSIHHNSQMWAKSSAFLIWAAVAAGAVFWALRLWGAAPEAPAHAQPAPVTAVVRADLSRVLGPEPAVTAVGANPTPAPAAEQGRFQLMGVIAPAGAGSPGWATLSVDGKPPRTFRVGHVVDGTRVLQKVSARGVDIGPRGGAPVVSLALSPLPPAASGRPGAGGSAGPALGTGAGAAPPPAEASAEPSADVPPPAPGLRRPGVVTR